MEIAMNNFHKLIFLLNSNHPCANRNASRSSPDQICVWVNCESGV